MVIRPSGVGAVYEAGPQRRAVGSSTRWVGHGSVSVTHGLARTRTGEGEDRLEPGLMSFVHTGDPARQRRSAQR